MTYLFFNSFTIISVKALKIQSLIICSVLVLQSIINMIPPIITNINFLRILLSCYHHKTYIRRDTQRTSSSRHKLLSWTWYLCTLVKLSLTWHTRVEHDTYDRKKTQVISLRRKMQRSLPPHAHLVSGSLREHRLRSLVLHSTGEGIAVTELISCWKEITDIGIVSYEMDIPVNKLYFFDTLDILL